MVRADGLLAIVEIGEIAGPDIHRAYAEARLSGIDQIEIDKLFDRPSERLCCVDAQSLRRARWKGDGRRDARFEEPRQPEHGREGRARLVEKGPRLLTRYDRLGQ